MQTKQRIFVYNPADVDAALLDKSHADLRYIAKKTYDRALEEGRAFRIVGKTTLRKVDGAYNKSLCVGDAQYAAEAGGFTYTAGFIPVGGDAVLEYRKSLLPFLLVFLALLAALISGIVLVMQPKRSPVIQPDYELVEEDEAQTPIEEIRNAHMMIITLPQGDITFDGTFFDYSNEKARADASEFKETPFTGSVHLKVWRNIGYDTLIFDDSVRVKNGAAAEAFLNFDIQKAELDPGVYDGTMEFDYGEGNVLTQPLTVVVRNRNSGSMGIGFAPEVTVNRTNGAVTCYYEVDYTGTHDTILQLILDKNGEEFLLAESGIVTPGHSVTRLNLRDGVVDRVARGVYSGRLRLNFYSPGGKTAETNLNSDIEVKIRIQ